METRHLRKSVAASDRTNPPLSKRSHCGVMLCHLFIQSPNFPAVLSQPQAEFRFLSGDEPGSEPADFLYRLYPNQCITTASRGFSNGRVPLIVEQPVVD